MSRVYLPRTPEDVKREPRPLGWLFNQQVGHCKTCTCREQEESK